MMSNNIRCAVCFFKIDVYIVDSEIVKCYNVRMEGYNELIDNFPHIAKKHFW